VKGQNVLTFSLSQMSHVVLAWHWHDEKSEPLENEIESIWKAFSQRFQAFKAALSNLLLDNH